MKKLIAILLAAAILLCFAGCQLTETEKPGGKEPVQDSYSFTYNGTKIALHAPAADVLAGLGKEKAYSESTSCAFEGLDKVYDYGSFCLQTYPIGDKDYIYGGWFVDDLLENDEGICIGSSQADVEAAYGADKLSGNSCEIVKGSGKLIIILENEVVTSVQYAVVTD